MCSFLRMEKKRKPALQRMEMVRVKGLVFTSSMTGWGLDADCSGLFSSICSQMGQPEENVRKMDSKTLDTFPLAQQSVNLLNKLAVVWKHLLYGKATRFWVWKLKGACICASRVRVASILRGFWSGLTKQKSPLGIYTQEQTEELHRCLV